MAGTIVADTLQNGAGSSTSMDNAINGSAKAWVRFNGVTTATIGASYNVSSVTRISTGIYSVSFTNALTDANYSALATTTYSGTANVVAQAPNYGGNTGTASIAYIGVTTFTPAVNDSNAISFAAFR